MKKEEADCCSEGSVYKKYHKHHGGGSNNGGGAIYGLGVVGALFYFLQNASSFGMVMMGIGKSVFWPAILMYKLLTYLKM